MAVGAILVSLLVRLKANQIKAGVRHIPNDTDGIPDYPVSHRVHSK